MRTAFLGHLIRHHVGPPDEVEGALELPVVSDVLAAGRPGDDLQGTIRRHLTKLALLGADGAGPHALEVLDFAGPTDLGAEDEIGSRWCAAASRLAIFWVN